MFPKTDKRRKSTYKYGIGDNQLGEVAVADFCPAVVGYYIPKKSNEHRRTANAQHSADKAAKQPRYEE